MRFKRLISILIDYIIICMIVIPVTWILEDIFNISGYPFARFVDFNNYNGIRDLYSAVFKDLSHLFQIAIIWIVFSLKDFVFKNASIGKKILRMEILTMSNKKPTIMPLVLRNLFVIIWPIEILLILILNRRIGDLVFKTKVVEGSKIIL